MPGVELRSGSLELVRRALGADGDLPGRPLALWSFSATNGIIFAWFGFIDGFLDHVLKALGLNHTTVLPGGEADVVTTVYSLWSPEAGNLFYEGTGVLTFLGSVVALYYNYRVLRTFRTIGLTTTSSMPEAGPHRRSSSAPHQRPAKIDRAARRVTD